MGEAEDNLSEDFKFYLKFAKPLVFSLPDKGERYQAAAWIKRIMQEKDENVKLQYLQLFLFVLQRKQLGGVFKKNPSEYPELKAFPEKSLIDVARKMVEDENVEKIKTEGLFPPILSDYSPDLLEYVAVQKIPNFGVHAYYAISKEPLYKWNGFENAIFPKVTDSMLDIMRVSKEQQESTPIIKSSPEFKRSKTVEPPVTPLGIVTKDEERLPPTWGSNLLQVKGVHPTSPITASEKDENNINNLEWEDIREEYEEFKTAIEDFSKIAGNNKIPDNNLLDNLSPNTTITPPPPPPCYCLPRDKEISLIFNRAYSISSAKNKNENSPILHTFDSPKELQQNQMERLSALFENNSPGRQESNKQPNISSSKNNLKEVVIRKTILENTSPAIKGLHPLTSPKPCPYPLRPGDTSSTSR